MTTRNTPAQTVTWWSSLHATSTRRALLLTALGGLLIAGVITALPRSEAPRHGCNASTISLGPRGNETFDNAKSGDCLNWPDRTPDAAEVVDCKDEHRFEVAESVDMRTFPGSEYGPDAAPPSPARIQQISQEQCQVAVRRYLGARFDPNSRFTVSMMWSGDKAWRQSGERRMLCGLQLPGPNNQQLAFQGKVADIDQSKVWPAGTCLGIDPTTNQPTDIPVDCAAPHAMEVTGAVNLAEKFPGRAAARTRTGHVHQGRLHPDDRRLPGADPAAQHHADADLQHHLAAQLVGGQPPGVVQHRRHARQRRLVDAAQQRQGPAADQRSAADTAAGHPRGAAEPPADPDARRRHRRRQVIVTVGRRRPPSPTESDEQRPAAQHMPQQSTGTTATRAHRADHACRGHRATRSSTGRLRRRQGAAARRRRVPAATAAASAGGPRRRHRRAAVAAASAAGPAAATAPGPPPAEPTAAAAAAGALAPWPCG